MKTYTQEEVNEMLKEYLDRITMLENHIMSLQGTPRRRGVTPQEEQEFWDQKEEERQFYHEVYG